MKPIKFKEANRLLGRPQSMNDGECSNLWVLTDETTCVSCWRLSFRQRLSALLFGKVWLGILSGGTQPPVWLKCTKNIFK